MNAFSRTYRPWMVWAAFACLSIAPQAGFAQDKGHSGDLETLLSGPASAVTLKMKDLASPGWRRLKVSGGSEKKEDSSLGMLGAMFGGGGEGMGGLMSSLLGPMLSGVSTAGPDVYYTRGQTLVMGGDTFLIAYQPETKAVDFSMLMKMKDMDSPPPPKPLTQDSPLAMSLLNLHTIGHLTGIQPVDVAQEIAASEESAKTIAELAKEEAKDKKDDALFDPDTEPAKPAAKPAAKPTTKKKTTSKKSG